MPLTINGRFLSRPMTGVDRVAENILLRIDSIWPTQKHGRYKVAVPRGTQRTLDLENGDITPIGTRNGLFWEQFELPAACKGDILFNPCNTAPLRHQKNIVTIHDANVMDYPASYSRGFRAWYNFLLPRIARRAKSVITVSNHSADRLMHHQITPRRAITILNGCDHLQTSITPFNQVRDGALFVGSPAAHKNLDLFIRLAAQFEDAGVPFLVAGSRSESVFSSADSSITLPKNLTFLGRITEQHLIELYQTAKVLIFPSFVEGFGLTPLEAQSFNCPVISSNRAPMTELLADSALFADPESLTEWEDALGGLLSSQDKWNDLSSRAGKNAKRFTWDAAALQYLRVLTDALSAEASAEQTSPSCQSVA